PKNLIKPKLFFWLSNDVKRIAQASGTLKINGLGTDFPFDANNGEFSLISHAMGGEITINSKWPLMTQLEGYIKLKNRNLDIDLVNGDLQGVPVKQMNLRINDIGKDKETLLIHGIVEGQAQKMLRFVMQSPLSKKLAKLSILIINGVLSLDLNLEIPLYPENDDNLAKGQISFRNNTIQVTNKFGYMPIEDVAGTLFFTEKGVMNSVLNANACGYPLNMTIQSTQIPQFVTSLFIDGKCSIEALKGQFNFPILTLFKGIFLIQGELKITDEPHASDRFNLNSSLEGLAVNLPQPFGKTFDSKAPLSINLEFNNQQTIRLVADYNKRFSTDILFKESKNIFELNSGQIRLGGANALNQQKDGLDVVGVLDGFDLQEWNNIYLKFSSQMNQNSFLEKLTSIDLTLNKLSVIQQAFNNIKIKASVLPKNVWSINLEQKKISADITYSRATHSISGFVKFLHLDKVKFAQVSSTSSLGSPRQIPNLNLRIDNLSIGEKQVGNVTLNSTSSLNKWLINYCHIDSPFYQFIVNGEWTQFQKNNQTKLKVSLHLNDLAKSLQRWEITPAVDAGKGDIEFNGGWNGRVYDFSIAAVKGTLSMQLKNGIITHLSPETEEKLGLGKLLSVLSLQTIPRRLKLDFSDLSHQGYSFDIFKGNFILKNGIMNTQDSYIDGPVAYASMKGDLDLARRMYDLDLSISPHITASLPIVATIAGGPIVGLAAWVANKIINQSMQKITAYSYKITGPWNQPVVQQLSIVKKIIKK
ncbi:MAG: AsmA-like C-terminal region-containing protein, partial [bacterium]|nr:AsmA-like C-terminal region-containing protein [bacterium]